MSGTRPRLGSFELIRPIGRGGMGLVWEARHVPTGEAAAVKTLRSEVAADPAVVRMVEREVRAVATLDHPNIVRVFDQGTVSVEAAASSAGRLTPGTPYLVMELVTGGDLNRHRGTLGWPKLHQALLDVLAALAHAHARGVLHRDLKPGNVLLEPPSAGSQATARLTDFGIARVLPSADRDIEEEGDAFYGTPSYAPAEQVIGPEVDVGPWTDLYAVGCLAWAMATGRPPYRGKSLAAVVEQHRAGVLPAFEPQFEVPDRFQDWLARMIRPRIEERFGSAASAAAALRLVGDPDEPTLRPTAPVALLSRRTPPLALGLGLFGLREVALVDREAERKILHRALQTARSRRGVQVVLLRGGPGIGKSKLARWLCEFAAEAGRALVLPVTHLERGGPRHGLGPALERLLRTEGFDEAQATRRLAARLETIGLAGEGTVNAVLALLRPGRDGSTVAGDPIGVASTLLTRLAARRPLLLFLDDLHHGAETAAVVEALLNRSDEHAGAVLVVGTVRDDLLDGAAAMAMESLELEGAVQSVALDRLGPADVRHLIEELLRVRGDLAERIAARSDGSPHFAIQIVGGLVRRGILVPTPEGFALATGAAVKLPADLRRLGLEQVAAAMEGATGDEQEALELAASLGRFVDLREWQRACVEAGLAIPHHLPGRLAARGLIVEEESGFRFAHGLARDAVEERARERKGWRLRCSACADAIAAVNPGAWTAERRGRLLLEAGRRDAAFDPLLAGAHHAALQGRATVGQELLDQADAILARSAEDDSRAGGLGLARAELLRLQGKHEAALTESLRTAQAASRRGDRRVEAQALRQAGVMTRMVGDVHDALPLLARSSELLRELEDRSLLTVTLAAQAQAFRAVGDHTALEATLGEAERYAADAPADAQQRVKMQRGRTLRTQRRWAEAEAAFGDAVALAQRVGSLHGEAQARLLLAQVHDEAGRPAAAEDGVRDVLELADRSGHPGDVSDAACFLGALLQTQGRLDDAAGMFRLAIDVGGRSDVPWRGVPRTHLGTLRTRQGRPREAIELFRHAVTDFGVLGRPDLVDYARCQLVEAELVKGDPAAASAVLDTLPSALDDVADPAALEAVLERAAARAETLERPDLGERLRTLGDTLPSDRSE